MNAQGPATQVVIAAPTFTLGLLLLACLAGMFFAPWLLVRRQGQPRPSSDMGRTISRGLLAVLGMLIPLAMVLTVMGLRVTSSRSVSEPVVFRSSGAAYRVEPYSGPTPLAPETAILPPYLQMHDSPPTVSGPEVPVGAVAVSRSVAWNWPSPAQTSSTGSDWSVWEPERLPTWWRTADGTANAPPEWATFSGQPAPPDCAVASSQWFATRDEAERQGTQRLVVDMYWKLAESDRWVVLSPRTLISHLTQSPLARPEGVLELTRKDFGNGLTANMYRAHYRLEHCGRVTSDMPRFWLTEARRSRSILLLSCLGGLTVVLAGTGWGLRRFGV
jgi:hypothetical protein